MSRITDANQAKLQVESDLRSRFNVNVNTRSVVTGANLRRETWGAQVAADEPAVIQLGIAIDKDHPKASQLPTFVDHADSKGIPIVYYTAGAIKALKMA